MAIPYASIDSGYIYDPYKKLDCLFSDFFEAENSQSYLFNGKITSFPWIIQQKQNDPPAIALEVQQQLRVLFLQYFDDCEVICEATDTSINSYDLYFYATVRQDQATASLNKVMSMSDTKIKESLTIRN